jgi:hypothetical protein
MLGWGSTKPVAPKPSILPELETPATREEFETLINKKYHLLLDLEGDAGWTRVPFTHDGLNDIELFERKSEEFPLWDIVKVRTTIKAPLQVHPHAPLRHRATSLPLPPAIELGSQRIARSSEIVGDDQLPRCGAGQGLAA